MNWLRFILGALATWRVTHLLIVEDGPWKVLAKFRRLVALRFFRGLLDCFYCLSLWVALPVGFFLGQTAADRLLSWLALSAAAILLENLSTRLVGSAPPASYFEEEGENNNGLLREEQSDKNARA